MTVVAAPTVRSASTSGHSAHAQPYEGTDAERHQHRADEGACLHELTFLGPWWTVRHVMPRAVGLARSGPSLAGGHSVGGPVVYWRAG